MKRPMKENPDRQRHLGRRLWSVVSGQLVAFGAVGAISWAAMIASPAPAKADSTVNAEVLATDGTEAAQQVPLLLAQAEPVASSLPGGASSLQEGYLNWQLGCAQNGAAKHCSISQQQVDPETRQRVLAVEIEGTHDLAQGVIVVPFGLSLIAGVTLQVDDSATKTPVAFRTCLPIGCIVPVSIDATGLEEWRKGSVLKLTTVSDAGQETVFTVSLDGFSAAYNRLDDLGK